MIRKLTFLIFGWIILLYACKPETPGETEIDYRKEMQVFVEEISTYAKGLHPGFIIIPQNGVELITVNGDTAGTPVREYLSAIDGMGQEELFYGYEADDEETPPEISRWLCGFLDMAKNEAGKKILVTDYCRTPAKVDNSYMQNYLKNYISFAADHRELDDIPPYPHPIFRENADSITHLERATNFLYLINPDNSFASKQEFINAVATTNYDLLITDLFFDGEAFTPQEVAQLRRKSNGGTRLVIAYMSIGEAEDYRYYWQPDWRPGNPSFIVKENPEWEGNYIVRYWDPAWKSIIYGNEQSYTKKIIDAGFDGAYLDIIDAYEQFEE